MWEVFCYLAFDEESVSSFTIVLPDEFQKPGFFRITPELFRYAGDACTPPWCHAPVEERPFEAASTLAASHRAAQPAPIRIKGSAHAGFEILASFRYSPDWRILSKGRFDGHDLSDITLRAFRTSLFSPSVKQP
jgi:hypothetical protein